jgi:hypothetical protein
MGTTVVPIQDVIAIHAGSPISESCQWVQLRHKGGRQSFLSQFTDFHEMLVTIRALNPSVDIKGF